MIFLVHSAINAQTIQNSLGLPEYSYYFVLKAYLTVLEELGTVIQISDPETEVDLHYDQACQQGVPCVLICFSPPHRAPMHDRCPTLCVFAWEFSNIPDTPWDDEPRNDWRYVLEKHGRTITLSSYTERVIQEVMGAAYVVKAIPVPLYNKQIQKVSDIAARKPALVSRTLEVDCAVIDSRFYEVDAENMIAHIPADHLRLPEWQGDSVSLNYQRGTLESGMLGGFYSTEDWGVWSRNATPWIVLPFRVKGRYRLEIELAPYGPNVHRTIHIAVGNQIQPLLLTDNFFWHVFEFDFGSDPTEQCGVIQFSGVDISGVPGARDPRSMGIGLRSLRLTRLSPPETTLSSSSPLPATNKNIPLTVQLDSVVYTSIFNPGDGRKNWLDMLTAFCFAFRNEPRATLVLKMTHHSLGSFLGKFHYMLQRVGAIQCRILILHGFLDEACYRELIDATTYCVNTSHGEGLCLPLMEFMSHGIPAVAPRHTAMLDYVSEENTFVVESSLEPAIWPHDTRALFHTMYYRIHWMSLVEAFRNSFRVAQDESERYERMSIQAQALQLQFCSHDVVRRKFAAFFNLESGVEGGV